MSIGPFQMYWYGLMYLFGFIAGWLLGRVRVGHPAYPLWTRKLVDDIVFYIVIGIIVGGRLGYTLFYDLDTFLADPLSVIRVGESGMSFHGGLIGVLIALALFARRHRMRFLQVGDFIAPFVAPGILFGRIGNFINGELWGRATDVPWAMRLPCERFPAYCVGLPADSDWSLALHPSQLYEAGLEGVVLFVLLWWYSSRPRPMMAVSGMFLLLYGVFRFALEFVRVPDAHIGYLAFDWLTMGQLLSLPMIVAGMVLLGLAYARSGALAPSDGQRPLM